jgi:predicted ferric reductase
MPGQPLTFVWSVKNRQEALYATEIATQVQRLPHATFRLHLSDEEGYLTARQLFEQCRQPAALTVFLCGPPAMMHKLKSQFRQMGLRRLSLITEEFALR